MRMQKNTTNKSQLSLGANKSGSKLKVTAATEVGMSSNASVKPSQQENPDEGRQNKTLQQMRIQALIAYS